MNFVWLDINSSWSHSSLALPALHANLSAETAAACNMQVVRGTIKSPLQQIVQELAALEPTYIFATGWLFNINYLNEVLSRISALCRPSGIFLGGPEFLGNNEDFLRTNRHVTAVFKGEGEEIFEPFITSLLAEDGAWKEIPGFEWIEEGIYHNSNNIIVQNFKELHYPEESELFSWDKSFVQIETSRGCFNSCRFCVSGIDKCPIQDIPIEDLRHRLKEISARGIKQIRVLDRTFNGKPARALQLLELFKEFAGELNFHLEVHPALLFPLQESLEHAPNGSYQLPASKRLRDALAAVPQGLLHIEAGIQTLRQEVLDICQRLGSCTKAIQGLKFLIGCGNFEVHADLIAGLPGYTYSELLEDTLSLMEIGPAEIQLESLKLLPGTSFRENAAQLGIKYSPVPPYEVLSGPYMNYKDLTKSMTLSKIIDLWYNDAKWREPFREIFSSQKSLMQKLIDELSGTEYMSQPLSLENKGILLYRFCKRHIPDMAPLISLQWVRNGLSIKKEPAENFCKWELSQGAESNPIFVEGDPRYKYYHLTYNGVRHWFSFNKEVVRVAPCSYLAQKTAN